MQSWRSFCPLFLVPVILVTAAETSPTGYPSSCPLAKPVHGSLGSCPNPLPSGQFCVAHCNPGFEANGVFGCDSGALSSFGFCTGFCTASEALTCKLETPPPNGAMGKCAFACKGGVLVMSATCVGLDEYLKQGQDQGAILFSVDPDAATAALPILSPPPQPDLSKASLPLLSPPQSTPASDVSKPDVAKTSLPVCSGCPCRCWSWRSNSGAGDVSVPVLSALPSPATAGAGDVSVPVLSSLPAPANHGAGGVSVPNGAALLPGPVPPPLPAATLPPPPPPPALSPRPPAAAEAEGERDKDKGGDQPGNKYIKHDQYHKDKAGKQYIGHYLYHLAHSSLDEGDKDESSLDDDRDSDEDSSGDGKDRNSRRDHDYRNLHSSRDDDDTNKRNRYDHEDDVQSNGYDHEDDVHSNGQDRHDTVDDDSDNSWDIDSDIDSAVDRPLRHKDMVMDGGKKKEPGWLWTIKKEQLGRRRLPSRTNSWTISYWKEFAVLQHGCSGDTISRESLFCTTDALACADGSYVGRDVDNNCDFFPCKDTILDEKKNSWGGKATYTKSIMDNSWRGKAAYTKTSSWPLTQPVYKSYGSPSWGRRASYKSTVYQPATTGSWGGYSKSWARYRSTSSWGQRGTYHSYTPRTSRSWGTFRYGRWGL
eukprot:g71499.t1